jgi:hypothetical protein
VGEHERDFVKKVFSKSGKHDRFSTACWGHDDARNLPSFKMA